MLGFQFDNYYSWLKYRYNRICNLRREPFLHLRPGGCQLECAAQLAYPGDFTQREITHTGFSEEGQQVVLADGIKG
jgi:hypothetical protein